MSLFWCALYVIALPVSTVCMSTSDVATYGSETLMRVGESEFHDVFDVPRDAEHIKGLPDNVTARLCTMKSKGKRTRAVYKRYRMCRMSSVDVKISAAALHQIVL